MTETAISIEAERQKLDPKVEDLEKEKGDLQKPLTASGVEK